MLASATVASQVILTLASPLLTRLYSPEDFGLLAIYISLLSIVSVIASLRYQLAIPLPEDDKKAASIVVLSLIIVGVITVFTTAVVFFFHDLIARALNSQKMEVYLWVLPVGILFVSIYQVFYYWALRTKAFTAIARTKLTQSFISIAIQVGGFSLGPLALMIGHISGQGAGFTSLGLLTIRKQWVLFKSVRLRHIFWAAKRYKHFPIYSSWSDLFNQAGSELPSLLFAALFNPVIAGFYLLTKRVLMMPATLIGTAIADVFFSHSSVAYRKGELAPLVASIHEKLVQLAMPLALGVILAGPTLFSMVFGKEWRQAGEFAQWMAPWVYVIFITSPLTNLVSVLEKQAQGMVFEVILFSTRVTAMIVGSHTGNVYLTVALFSLSGTLCWIGFLFWIIHASGNKVTIILESTFKAFLWSVGLVTPVAVVYFLPAYSTTPLWLTAFLLSAILIAARYANLIKKIWH